MLKYILFTAFCMLGCGNYEAYDWHIYAKPYIPQGSIDAEMQAYVDTFHQEADKRGVASNYSDLVAINWSDSLSMNGETLLGYCQIYKEPEGNLVSYIQLSTLIRTLPQSVQVVVFNHELAHCLLGVMHTNRDSDPLAIMFWASGDAQVANADNYADPTLWSGYLDYMYYDQNQEVYQ